MIESAAKGLFDSLPGVEKIKVRIVNMKSLGIFLDDMVGVSLIKDGRKLGAFVSPDWVMYLLESTQFSPYWQDDAASFLCKTETGYDTLAASFSDRKDVIRLIG